VPVELQSDWFARRYFTDWLRNFDLRQIPARPEFESGGFLRGHGWGTAGVATIQSGLPLTLTDSLGGAIYGGAGVSRTSAFFGVITGTSVAPRIIQFGLRYNF